MYTIYKEDEEAENSTSPLSEDCRPPLHEMKSGSIRRFPFVAFRLMALCRAGKKKKKEKGQGKKLRA